MRGATASENKVKSRNETLNVTSILEDPRDELLYDIQPDGSNVKATSCPEIEVTLENTVVNALIDKFQVLLSTTIKNKKINLIFIIVPKLVKPCILGYDTHKTLSMLIDTRNEEILFTINEHYAQISYKKAETQKSSCL